MKVRLEWQGYFLKPDDETYALLRDKVSPGQMLELELDEGQEWRTRTDQQRKAIEVFCRMLAEALNANNHDMRSVMSAMREGVEIPWTQERVKDSLWREIQKALIGKESTARLSPEEVSKVYEVVNKFTTTRLDPAVHVPFPERFGPMGA